MYKVEDLIENPIQPYLTDKVQLYQIVQEILKQTGRASVWITTYSISEEFIRAIVNLQEKELISDVHLILDHRAINKIAKLLPFMVHVFDGVYLASNHSKVVLCASERMRVSLTTSQNQTRGNRNESGVIIYDDNVFNSFYEQISELIDKSLPVQDVFTRTN